MNHPNSLSFWEYDSFLSKIDFAVIGSGIVGLVAALTLRRLHPDSRIIVIDRGALPEGASTRNAGFACIGTISELLDDSTSHTEGELFALVERRYKGLQQLRMLAGDSELDYQELGGFEIFRNSDKQNFEKCADAINTFNKHLYGITGRERTFRVAPAPSQFRNLHPQMIVNDVEGQLDAGRMMRSLMKLCHMNGIDTIGGLPVQTVHDKGSHVVITSEFGWEFRARRLLICTNGFASGLIPSLAVTPARNQVLVTEPIPDLQFRGCYHYDRGYFYFRNIGERVLIGGGRNLDPDKEMTPEFGTTDTIQLALRNFLSEIILPGRPTRIDFHWSGILGIGTQKRPIIEKYSENIGVAVRMGGMGVAIGTLVGQEAAELISG